MKRKPVIIITSPSLDTQKNIGGISSVARFLMENNSDYDYRHFELGKHDNEKRGVYWFLRIVKAWVAWFFLMIIKRDILIHFNIALEERSLIRDFPLILFARFLRKRQVIHIHGGELLHKEKGRNWIEILLKYFYSGKEPKIVLSSMEKKMIVSKYHAKNVFELPNTVDMTEAEFFNRQYPFQPPVKILYMGRIVKSKGLDYIIEALEILNKKAIPFKFIMAGSGPEEKYYLKKLSGIPQDCFEFKGLISGPLKTGLLKQCDIFLLPSLYEGLPVSLLEAMSFGLVPVVTEVGSINSVVKNGETGIIVAMRSSVNIAEAVERLIENDDLFKRISTNSRRYVFENHNPVDYINKLNKVYDYT